MSRRQRTNRLREQALEEDIVAGTHSRFHTRAAPVERRRMTLACDTDVKHSGNLRTRVTSMQNGMGATFREDASEYRTGRRNSDYVPQERLTEEETRRTVRVARPRGMPEMPETKRLSMHHIMAYRGDLLAEALTDYGHLDFVYAKEPKIGDPPDCWVGSTLADAFLDYIDTWKDSRYEEEGMDVAFTVMAVMQRFAVTRNAEHRRARRKTLLAQSRALHRQHERRAEMPEHEAIDSEDDDNADVYVGRRRKPRPADGSVGYF